MAECVNIRLKVSKPDMTDILLKTHLLASIDYDSIVYSHDVSVFKSLMPLDGVIQ